MSKLPRFLVCLALPVALICPRLRAAGAATNQMSYGDRMFTDYFETETEKLRTNCLADIHSLADWQARRPELRRQAAEMLGLDPMPERTELKPVITRKIDHGDFTVEKLYFQSRPHLYVTANLYLPKNLSTPVPAILYLCGHTPVVSNGVSYGNKTAYQHHGIWFARNGYACLVIDTLQWGEILGHHRGTYSEGMWWWNSRGYTPAGVETWNAMRALDYLGSRPEVNAERMGVTGRSGGGAYSWFLAALDDRVKVVVPAAGITDLRNYAVDGTVDNHCDCMFFVNTYRWDYPLLAALTAPRPLLLENTDTDSLFPLDGVAHTRDAVKRIYDLYGAATNFNIVIGPGPHKDIPELQAPAFRWFNLHLKHDDSNIDSAAPKLFSPAELKVFDKIPEDQVNTRIQDSFVPAAPPPKVPSSSQEWKQMKEDWMHALRDKCFAGWPADNSPLNISLLFSETDAGIQYEIYEVHSQPNVALRIYVMRKGGEAAPHELFLRIADSSFTDSPLDTAPASITQVKTVFGPQKASDKMMMQVKSQNVAHAVFFPRGIGQTAWTGGPAHETQIRRRFMLLGQTLDGMRVWDIRRAIQTLRAVIGFKDYPLHLEANEGMAVNALYASLFEPDINSLDLTRLPASHAEGPDYLNVLKYLDIPQAAAMAADRCPLRLQPAGTNGFDFLKAMASSPSAHLKVGLVK